MAVLEAVRTAPDATPIDPAHLRVDESAASPRVFVPDVAEWAERAARAGRLFSEAGAPFAIAAERS